MRLSKAKLQKSMFANALDSVIAIINFQLFIL